MSSEPAEAAVDAGVLRSGARWHHLDVDEQSATHGDDHHLLALHYEDVTLGRSDALHLGLLATRAGAPELLETREHIDGITLHLRARAARAGDAIEYRFDPQRCVELLARNLRAVHDTEPPDELPRLRVEDAIAEARRCTEAGQRRTAHDEAYAHLTAERLLAVLEDGADGLPEPADDLVLCHGDPTLAAARFHHAAPAGWIGWDRAVVADRHLDLAVAARAVASSIGPFVVPLLFEAYGIDRPEPRRLEWFALLDALR